MKQWGKEELNLPRQSPMKEHWTECQRELGICQQNTGIGHSRKSKVENYKESERLTDKAGEGGICICSPRVSRQWIAIKSS